MKFYLYILDTLADWEIGYLTAELNTGRYLRDQTLTSGIINVSHSLNPVTSLGGMELKPDISIGDVKFEKGDFLILPGADTWLDGKNDQVLGIIDKLLETGITVAAICGATGALACKGLLNTRKHTSNDVEYLKMVCQDYTGSNLYQNLPAVVDGNLITATGLAPVDFTYEILKRSGLMKPETVEAWYGLYKTREPQYFYSLMTSLEA